MAALNYLAPRLGTTASALIADRDPAWERVEADLALASGDWQGALDAYGAMLETVTDRRGTRRTCRSGIAECLCRLNRAREAIRPATEAVEAFTELDRFADLPHAEYWLASAQYQSENLDGARTIVNGLIGRVRDGLMVSGDFHVRLLVSAAMIETASGNPAQALAYLEEARARTADLDVRRRASFLATLAAAYREAGDLEGAIRNGQDAIALMRHADADAVVQQLENELALAYLANGNRTRAAALAHEARSAAAIAWRPAPRGAPRGHRSRDRARRGRRPSGHRTGVARRSRSPTRIGNDRAHLEALITRAKANAAQGEHEAAAADFEAAAERATRPARPAS